MELWLESPTRPGMPLGPNDAAYNALDVAGVLNITTARDDGVLVGYVLGMIYPHIHYSSVVCGFVDSFYLRHGSRLGRTGIRLIKEGLRNMKDAGAMKVFFVADTGARAGRLFQRLGFTMEHETYALWVGDR